MHQVIRIVSAPLRAGLAIAAIAATIPAAPAQPPEKSPIDQLYQLGSDLFDAYVPPELLDELTFPSHEEWQTFWRDIRRILASHSLDDLAAWRPAVAVALKYLEFHDEAQPLIAWLQQQMDYFALADEVVGARPIPAPPPDARALRPVPRPAPPSITEQEAAAQRATIRNRTVWENRLRQRPPPAGATRILPPLKQIFIAEGVAPEWVWIAEVESSMNPRARSPAGAVGLFQFMPATAERFGLRLRPQDERYSPEKSARAAARYLTFLHQRFGCWALALAAYNSGEGRVGRLLQGRASARFDDIADRLPLETQMYVPKVLATVALRENVDPMTLPPPPASR